MDNLFNIPANAIKTVDRLLQNFREETIDEVEESFLGMKISEPKLAEVGAKSSRWIPVNRCQCHGAL